MDERFHRWVRGLEGKSVEVTVRKERKGRSPQANRYYWGVVVALLSEHTGYTPEEMHEALKEKFLGEERDSVGLVKIRSSAGLTVDEFIQYTNRIVMWAAQSLGVYIPDPGHVDY